MGVTTAMGRGLLAIRRAPRGPADDRGRHRRSAFRKLQRDTRVALVDARLVVVEPDVALTDAGVLVADALAAMRRAFGR